MKEAENPLKVVKPAQYHQLFHGVSALLEAARRSAVKAVNAITTATYWEIGRRIVHFEQRGEGRCASWTGRLPPSFMSG